MSASIRPSRLVARLPNVAVLNSVSVALPWPRTVCRCSRHG